LMRLPREIRLEILAYVLYDAGEVTFNFKPSGDNTLFSDALEQHAIQIMSGYSRETERPLAWYPLHWFGRDPCLAPQWKNQVFVEIREHAPRIPKRSDARKIHMHFTQKKCVHGDKLCPYCHYRTHQRGRPQRADGRVLRVCKGIYYEALPVLYQLNVFDFANAYEMGAVLHGMGPGRAFIRYVDVMSPLYHGGILWDYLVPCKTIRQLYFPESACYDMFRGGQLVPEHLDEGPEFFSGWIIRGGQAFFDMIRKRDRGETDPLSILVFYDRSCATERSRRLMDGLRSWLPVDDREPRSVQGTDPLTSTVRPFRPEVFAVADWRR
jgi:hypothetical protein